MAALALLFAIHSFHPAPFFVLDEVSFQIRAVGPRYCDKADRNRLMPRWTLRMYPSWRDISGNRRKRMFSS